MEKNITELVFILDKSGSMAGLESDTIGGFNAMLKKQQAMPGECRITTVLFDNGYELLHDRIDMPLVSPMAEGDYIPGGSTALLDAIGMTIQKIAKTEKYTKSGKVIFVIITDGEENASREYSPAAIKKMIEREKKNGWEFIFLGANIDAVAAAGNLGINAERAVNYVPDEKGTELNFRAMSDAVGDFRANRPISDASFNMIRKDMAKRGKK